MRFFGIELQLYAYTGAYYFSIEVVEYGEKKSGVVNLFIDDDSTFLKKSVAKNKELGFPYKKIPSVFEKDSVV
jgi:hypothetical protein